MPENERMVKLVALHQGAVIGHLGLEAFSRIRRSHAGSVGMAVALAWQGKGVGSKLLAAALDVADNWMNLHRVELSVYADNEAAIGSTASSASRTKACSVTTPCVTGNGSTP
jgi:putative acetyltransferase